MAIQPKVGVATIVPKKTVDYTPATFEDYMCLNFIEATAEQVLANIEPATFDFIPGEKFITVDTETFYTGLPNNRLPSTMVRRWIKVKSKYIPNDFPFCISISDGTNAYVVYDTLENKFQEFKKLETLLADSSISKVGHNIGYDMHMLANARVNMKGRLYDTMFLSKLTRAEAFTHSLYDIATEAQRLGYPIHLQYENMLDAYKARYKITDYRQIPHDLMTQYTCADVWNTMIIFQMLYPMLKEYDVEQLYNIEIEMLVVAYAMERRGIKLDLEYEHVLIPELINECDEAERNIYESAGVTFNINSGQQLEAVLKQMGYGHLIEYNKPTEGMLSKGIVKGNPKFDKFEMERLENEGVPLIANIQRYKNAEKLLNTFAIKLYEMRDFDGYVHCNFNTIEAKTGRFSISAPSMQNLPRRKDDRVRGAFIAPECYRLYDFDFKSQESIILAHYSRAEYLLEMVRKGEDIHKATASLVYSKNVADVTKSERSDAKSVGFAVTYGAGASKVASMTGKSLEEAQYIIKTYMKNIPEVDVFIRTANKVAKERKRIKTVLGRQVYVERGREYACVNYVIQGSAADSTKSRMVEIYKFLKANNYKSYPILQVHDSLLQCIHEDEQQLLGYLRWLQTERQLFRVDITVDVAVCHPTWKDKQDIEVDTRQPPDAELMKMLNYNIWEEGLF